LLTGEIVQDMSDEYSSLLSQQNLTNNMTIELIANYKVTVACTLAFFVGIIQFIMVYKAKVLIKEFKYV
jgi:hypothetical protein